MARSSQAFNKKEKEKQRQKKQQEKAEKMAERKANEKKGKSLDDMMAYIDEDGNIVDTPPDPSRKREINLEDIEIGVPKFEAEEPGVPRTGSVTFFNDAKGFGFIKDSRSGDSVFIHINNLSEPIAEGDKVSFEIGKGPKGPIALDVKKLPK